jgi:hypothetical protein
MVFDEWGRSRWSGSKKDKWYLMSGEDRVGQDQRKTNGI